MSILTQDRPAKTEQPSARQAAPHAVGAASSQGVHRVISLVAAMGLFWPLSSAWANIVATPSAGLAVVAISAGVLWLSVAIATAADEETLSRLDRWLLALALLSLAAWTAAKLSGSGGYGTDEAAFEQGAANLLLHGHDPYGASLLPALAAFSTPAKFMTYTMSGGTVSTFGYPALPLLALAPFIELTHNGQAVPIAQVCVLMVATVIVFRQLPPAWRGLAIVVCVGFPMLSGFALGGANLIIATTALLGVAYRWTSTGVTGSLTRGDRLRAIALGLALSTNQLTWFLAPFVLTGTYLLRRSDLGSRAARGITLRYLGIAAGTFALINAPFFIWDPAAWINGVLAPVAQHAIPYGQGIVDLTLFLRVGGGALDAYNYAAALLYIALLVLYVARFRTLGRACFILPLAALFLSGRSLSAYWATMIAVLVVGAATADRHLIGSVAPPLSLRRWPVSARRAAAAALFLPALTLLAVALSTPQPLQMRILSARSSKTLRRVQQIRVFVRNRSDAPLRPVFATNVTGQAVLWHIASGPPRLAAQAGALYRLTALDASSMPANGTPFLLVGLTDSPRTISSTGEFTKPGVIPGNW